MDHETITKICIGIMVLCIFALLGVTIVKRHDEITLKLLEAQEIAEAKKEEYNDAINAGYKIIIDGIEVDAPRNTAEDIIQNFTIIFDDTNKTIILSKN